MAACVFQLLSVAARYWKVSELHQLADMPDNANQGPTSIVFCCGSRLLGTKPVSRPTPKACLAWWQQQQQQQQQAVCRTLGGKGRGARDGAGCEQCVVMIYYS